MKRCNVYVIINLLDGTRYVGKTIYPIHIRFKQHHKNAQRNSQCHLACAIRKYGFENFAIFLLEIASSEVVAFKSEQFWIYYFRSFNLKLYNMDSGGKGGKHDLLQISSERLRRSLASRQSTITLWQNNRDKMIASMHTPEARYNRSEATKRRYATQKLENCSWTKLTEQVAKNIILDAANGLSRQELCEKYDVKYSTVRFLLIGKTWKYLERP